MSIEPKLEEAVLAYLYGDDEDDPGALVAKAAAAQGFDAWIAGLAADQRLLKRAVGADADRSDALARLAALQHEVADCRGASIVQLSAKARTEPARPIDLAARRREKLRTYAWVGTLAALAAGILVAVMSLQGGPETPPAPRPSVAQARQWVDELAPGGFGFAGDSPSPHDRGFLLGIVRDLAAPHADGTDASADEVAAARQIALLALAGLDLGDDPSTALSHALIGCTGSLKAADEVAACERGGVDYARHRDAALTPPADGGRRR